MNSVCGILAQEDRSIVNLENDFTDNARAETCHNLSP